MAFVMWMASHCTHARIWSRKSKKYSGILTLKTYRCTPYAVDYVYDCRVSTYMYPGGGTGVIPELSFFLGADNTAEAVIASE